MLSGFNLASCFRLSLLAGLSLFFGTACSRSYSPPQLTFVNGAEPETLDPHIITGQPDYRICQALGEGLTARNGRGEVEPGLASSWEISPDGCVYLFTLRPSQWSNGEPLTTEDLVASWERALRPELASPYAEVYFPIVGAQDFHEGRLKEFSQVGVRALDKQRLEVRLNHPTPFFLDLCSLPTLQPVYLKGIAQWGQEWIKPGKLVTNGAYLLLDWRLDDRIRLEKNPHYWRAETVSIKRIDILTTSKATTAFNLFYSGQADLIMDKSLIPAFFVDRLLDKSYFHAAANLATYYYRFNVTRKPLNDDRVRRALSLAIDRQQLVTKVTRAGEPVADSFTPHGIPGYEPPTGLAYDPAKARELLGQAGFPGGKNFPLFSVLYNSSEQNEQVATAIQAMWQENLGIHVLLRKQEWKVYLNSLSELDYDIARSSWVGDYNDPNTFLDQMVTGRGNNRTGWSNAPYDALIEQANKQGDRAARFALLRQAENLLVNEEAPIAPLFYYVGIALYHPEALSGYQPNVIDEHPLREMRIKR